MTIHKLHVHYAVMAGGAVVEGFLHPGGTAVRSGLSSRPAPTGIPDVLPVVPVKGSLVGYIAAFIAVRLICLPKSGFVADIGHGTVVGGIYHKHRGGHARHCRIRHHGNGATVERCITAGRAHPGVVMPIAVLPTVTHTATANCRVVIGATAFGSIRVPFYENVGRGGALPEVVVFSIGVKQADPEGFVAGCTGNGRVTYRVLQERVAVRAGVPPVRIEILIVILHVHACGQTDLL